MYAENRVVSVDKVEEVEEIPDKKGLKGRKDSVKKTKRELDIELFINQIKLYYRFNLKKSYKW